MPLTQPKTDLAYLRNEKAKAEQKLRSCQHREKILERQMSELNRRERVHRLCTRAGMLESFLVCPGELTDDQVMELLKISFRQPEVVLALAKMVHERYLHLRENGAGVGFATYNKVTGEPLESGQISEKNLPPDRRNSIPAARNWYLFELSDDDRKVIQQESVKILENIPQAGIGRRRIWEPETLPKDIRLINSHYDDLYRIPDGGVIQVDYPDGRSFTARLEHLDDYHFDMGGLGNVFHICQFAEVMERNHANFYPEIQTQDEQAAWELGGKGYLAIQSCEDGWDYTFYHSDYSVMDGGQLDAPELTIQEAREQILEAHHMEKGRRLLRDYDAVMDKVAEAEELSADHRPSTLEKLAELANDTSAPKSSAHSAPEL